MTRLFTLLLFAVITSAGCSGDVSTTEDSTRIQVDVPKVEIGDKPIDANPKTDGDVDIDTPIAGDK